MTDDRDADGRGGLNRETGAQSPEGTGVAPVTHRSGDGRDGPELVSDVVISALADAEGVTPAEMATPLYEFVDPDALDRLFETGSDNAGGRVVFSYASYRVAVTVDDDGVRTYVYTDA